MPQAGDLQIRLSKLHARAAAQWLTEEAVQAAIVAGPHHKHAEVLLSLGRRLLTAADRKHVRALFTVPVPPEEAQAFAALRWPTITTAWVEDSSQLLGCFNPFSHKRIASVQRRFLLVLARRSRGKGNRPHSFGQKTMRVAGNYKLLGQDRKDRLSREVRRERAWQAYCDEIERRGETALTTTLRLENFLK